MSGIILDHLTSTLKLRRAALSEIEHQFLIQAARHAQQHPVAGLLLFFSEKHVAMVGTPGENRGQACSSHTLLARSGHLYPGCVQGFDDGLVGANSDYFARFGQVYPE